MEMFWRKGYEATSLDDLCGVTGLSRSSLYAAFGSKRDLLLLSVDRYVELRTPRIATLLAQPMSIQDAFASLARQFIDQIIAGPGRRGCFIGNCARRAGAQGPCRAGAGAQSSRSHGGDVSRCARSRRGSRRADRRCGRGRARPLPHRRIPGPAPHRKGERKPLSTRRHCDDDAAMPGTAAGRAQPLSRAARISATTFAVAAADERTPFAVVDCGKTPTAGKGPTGSIARPTKPAAAASPPRRERPDRGRLRRRRDGR